MTMSLNVSKVPLSGTASAGGAADELPLITVHEPDLASVAPVVTVEVGSPEDHSSMMDYEVRGISVRSEVGCGPVRARLKTRFGPLGILVPGATYAVSWRKVFLGADKEGYSAWSREVCICVAGKGPVLDLRDVSGDWATAVLTLASRAPIHSRRWIWATADQMVSQAGARAALRVYLFGGLSRPVLVVSCDQPQAGGGADGSGGGARSEKRPRLSVQIIHGQADDDAVSGEVEVVEQGTGATQTFWSTGVDFGRVTMVLWNPSASYRVRGRVWGGRGCSKVSLWSADIAVTAGGPDSPPPA